MPLQRLCILYRTLRCYINTVVLYYAPVLCLQVISIFGQPENCTNACKEILQVMQQEATNNNRRFVAFSLTTVLFKTLLSCLTASFSATSWMSGPERLTSLKQEMMGWQWHQLDDYPKICTRLKMDNHTSALSLSFFLQAGCSS